MKLCSCGYLYFFGMLSIRGMGMVEDGDDGDYLVCAFLASCTIRQHSVGGRICSSLHSSTANPTYNSILCGCFSISNMCAYEGVWWSNNKKFVFLEAFRTVPLTFSDFIVQRKVMHGDFSMWYR
jgi:hypothetical protein